VNQEKTIPCDVSEQSERGWNEQSTLLDMITIVGALSISKVPIGAQVTRKAESLSCFLTFPVVAYFQ
jgi:hypothetical protein